MTCPMSENARGVSTTMSPVTHTAEVAVKKASSGQHAVTGRPGEGRGEQERTRGDEAEEAGGQRLRGRQPSAWTGHAVSLPQRLPRVARIRYAECLRIRAGISAPSSALRRSPGNAREAQIPGRHVERRAAQPGTTRRRPGWRSNSGPGPYSPADPGRSDRFAPASLDWGSSWLRKTTTPAPRRTRAASTSADAPS